MAGAGCEFDAVARSLVFSVAPHVLVVVVVGCRVWIVFLTVLHGVRARAARRLIRAELYKTLTPAPPRYFDRKFHGDETMYFKKLDQSCTLYVGNLSFYTSEEQIFELFSTAGDVKRIIMGLDRVAKTPCGFCFVEYAAAAAATRASCARACALRTLCVDAA